MKCPFEPSPLFSLPVVQALLHFAGGYGWHRLQDDRDLDVASGWRNTDWETLRAFEHAAQRGNVGQAQQVTNHLFAYVATGSALCIVDVSLMWAIQTIRSCGETPLRVEAGVARRSRFSVAVLVELLENHVRCLARDALNKITIEHYRKIARMRDTRPAIVSVNSSDKKSLPAFARALELGKGSPYNHAKGRPSNPGNVETRVAKELFEWVRANPPKNLPPPSRQTYKLWWAYIRKTRWLEQLYGEQFEVHPIFAAKYDKTASHENRRKIILTRLEQAFRVLLRKE